MSEHHSNPGAAPGKADPKKAEADAAKGQAKAEAARAERAAEEAAQRAERAQEKAGEKAHEKRVKAGQAARAKAEKRAKSKGEGEAEVKEEAEEEEEPEEEVYVAKAKPELDDETAAALSLRAQKQRKAPRFRRQEWWRYKDLGGKHAPWRRPRGIHSKMRRHYKYRPPLVSIGYRTPAAARGLHPSGFEEILVHRPDDLDAIDPKTQAARIGGTVGGRKAEAIQTKADELGIRILNRRSM